MLVKIWKRSGKGLVFFYFRGKDTFSIKPKKRIEREHLADFYFRFCQQKKKQPYTTFVSFKGIFSKNEDSPVNGVCIFYTTTPVTLIILI